VFFLSPVSLFSRKTSNFAPSIPTLAGLMGGTVRLAETEVLLPAQENGNPDWQYMEDYIKSLPYGDKIE